MHTCQCCSEDDQTGLKWNFCSCLENPFFSNLLNSWNQADKNKNCSFSNADEDLVQKSGRTDLELYTHLSVDRDFGHQKIDTDLKSGRKIEVRINRSKQVQNVWVENDNLFLERNMDSFPNPHVIRMPDVVRVSRSTGSSIPGRVSLHIKESAEVISVTYLEFLSLEEMEMMCKWMTGKLSAGVPVFRSLH